MKIKMANAMVEMTTANTVGELAMITPPGCSAEELGEPTSAKEGKTVRRNVIYEQIRI